MSKIRINDLARELEVKSKTILDVLPEIGDTEQKTHSSSLEEHEAEKVPAHLRAGSEASVTSKPARPSPDGDEIKTKNDLSHLSNPSDVPKPIISKQQPAPSAAAAASSGCKQADRTYSATSASSPNHCSADRTTSGLQGSDSSSSFIRRCRKTCARTSSTRATDLPTPSARRSISATVITARRAAADASHAAITCGCASTWSRARQIGRASCRERGGVGGG